MNDILNVIKILIKSPNNCPKTFKTLAKKIKVDKSTKDFEVCSYCKYVENLTKKKNM